MGWGCVLCGGGGAEDGGEEEGADDDDEDDVECDEGPLEFGESVLFGKGHGGVGGDGVVECGDGVGGGGVDGVEVNGE